MEHFTSIIQQVKDPKAFAVLILLLGGWLIKQLINKGLLKGQIAHRVSYFGMAITLVGMALGIWIFFLQKPDSQAQPAVKAPTETTTPEQAPKVKKNKGLAPHQSGNSHTDTTPGGQIIMAGVVVDKDTDEALTEATIQLLDQIVNAGPNGVFNGKFEYTGNPSNLELIISCPGYKPAIFPIRTANGSKHFQLTKLNN